MGDVRKRFDAFLTEVDKMQEEILQELGEKCVTLARNLPPEQGFHDQTGNLRSSIGYVIFKDGVAIRENYKAVSGVTEKGETNSGDEGIRKGKELAGEVGKETKGLCLVVTAGMEYAAALEAGGAWKLKSRRAYDVLASAEILAQRELPRMLDQFIKEIKLAAE